MGVILMLSVGEATEEEAHLFWKAFVKCRARLSGVVDLECCLEVRQGVSAERLSRWLGESITYVSFSQ